MAPPIPLHKAAPGASATSLGRVEPLAMARGPQAWSAPPVPTVPVNVPIESLGQAVMIADTAARLVAVNPAFTALTGYAAHEVLHRNIRLLRSGRHGAAFYAELWAVLQRDGVWQGEIWNRRKDGSLLPTWQTISVVHDTDGAVAHTISLFSDIRALKTAEDQLKHLAHHDPLTGLPNRLLFNSVLEGALRRARRHGRQLALLFIDLDGFKQVNDTLGHAAGDQVLCTVGARLRAAVRGEDMVARLGGDEFTVVLEEVSSAAAAAHTAAKLQQALGRPLLLGGRLISVSASVGVAVYPDDGIDAASLMDAADGAMYRGKRGIHAAQALQD